MIYHYFGKDRLASILTDEEIKPFPVIVYEDLAGTKPVQLANAIWFSVNPEMENSILPAARLRGLNPQSNGDIWRIGWEGETYVRTLARWAITHCYSPYLFHWMCLTAGLCGSCFCCWRLYHRPLQKSSWKSLEMLIAGKWELVDYSS